MENPLGTAQQNGESDAVPPVEKAGKTPPSLTRLRTYQDDIAEAVKSDNMSAAKIFLAEEERRHQREEIEVASSPETPKNRLLLVGSFVLVLAGIAGFAYFRFAHRPTAPAEMPVDVPAFIRTDKVTNIPVEDRSYRDVQDDLRRAVGSAVPGREVHQVALSEARLNPMRGESDALQISSDRLFGAIGAYPPSELARALSPNFFIGVYGSSKGPMPFLILESSDPSLARAAMLAWEESMANDLAAIFPKADAYTRATANLPTRRVTWDDIVYSNRDARVLAQGDNDILIWGFGDNGAIIIASDAFIIPEMASRLTRDRELH